MVRYTRYLPQARRAPGSEWLKNHPRLLEIAYEVSQRLMRWSYPFMKRLNRELAERLMRWSEVVLKGWIFNCQMCGQCILHSTGMTCPMTCPKNLRNGPCGGVRPDGHCEVIPDLPCVWVQAWERSRLMRGYQDELLLLQPPVNHALKQTSAWINLLEERDTQTPSGWKLASGDASDGVG